jgi:predicted 3-demethylubiquinone-9 3-methyltransferase (glyoxalase superfamily)
LLLDLTTSSDRDEAKRAFEAMMTMKKIDIAALARAVSSGSKG